MIGARPFFSRVVNWQIEGDVVRQIFSEGQREVSSNINISKEVHTLETHSVIWSKADYYLYFLAPEISIGALRIEISGKLASLTDFAIKQRFLQKGHEERIVKLFERYAVKSGISNIAVASASPLFLSHGYKPMGNTIMKSFTKGSGHS